MADFALSAVNENHMRIEAALADARAEPSNPRLLPGLFRCLSLATGDAHLSDKYSASLIAAIGSICRNCSEGRGKATAALNALEAVFNEGDASIKAYAVDAACLLKTPGALRFMLNAAEDPQVLKGCGGMEDHVDEIVGMIYAASPMDGISELGRMLDHPCGEIRKYAAHRLLMFGAPGAPDMLASAAHGMLAESMKKGGVEASLLFRQGQRLSLSRKEWLPENPLAKRLARAARSFYEAVQREAECAGEIQRPPRKMRKAPGKPALRLVKAGKPAGPS